MNDLFCQIRRGSTRSSKFIFCKVFRRQNIYQASINMIKPNVWLRCSLNIINRDAFLRWHVTLDLRHVVRYTGLTYDPWLPTAERSARGRKRGGEGFSAELKWHRSHPFTPGFLVSVKTTVSLFADLIKGTSWHNISIKLLKICFY